jgi:hypothetical protein
MLRICKKTKLGKMIDTKLQKGDVIGFDAGKGSQSIKIFRPLNRTVVRLHFKQAVGSTTMDPSWKLDNFHWQLSKEEFKSLVDLMSAGTGHVINEIKNSNMPITWGYQLV